MLKLMALFFTLRYQDCEKCGFLLKLNKIVQQNGIPESFNSRWQFSLVEIEVFIPSDLSRSNGGKVRTFSFLIVR